MDTNNPWNSSKKDTITLVLETVNKVKTVILNYFTIITISLFFIWLTANGFFVQVYNTVVNSQVGSWIAILSVLVSLLIISVFVFAWIWVFNTTDKNEGIAKFVEELKNDNSIMFWTSNTIITQIIYFIVLGIFVTLWFFLGYNVWEMFVKMLWVVQHAFNSWIFNWQFWENLLQIWLSMALFLITIWTIPIIAQSANTFRSKVQSWKGMSKWVLVWLAFVVLIAITTAVSSMKIINSVDIIGSFTHDVWQLNLTHF